MKVLMVCLGNICRSPLAEGLLQQKIDKHGMELEVDSAGTSGHHVGEAPDTRMRATARQYGLSIDHLRSRQFVQSDFENFDLIYAMDSSNLNNILALARNEEDERKVRLILNETYPKQNLPVPDPYYGGDQGFVEVYTLLDEATNVIVENLKSNG